MYMYMYIYIYIQYSCKAPFQNPPFLGSWVQKQGDPGSVRFGCGLGMERLGQFRFSVPAVPLGGGGVFCLSVQINREVGFRFRFVGTGSDGSGSSFGSWQNGSDGSSFRFRFCSWATSRKSLRPCFQERKQTWNGESSTNILTNKSEQFEATHENVGFPGKKGQKVHRIFATNIAMEFDCRTFCAPDFKQVFSSILSVVPWALGQRNPFRNSKGILRELFP